MRSQFVRRILWIVPLISLMAYLEKVEAEIDESDFQDYDAIVKELSKTSSQAESTSRASYVRSQSGDAFDSIFIHAGVGLANLFGPVGLQNGALTYLNHRGVQASLGIDLFSENWMAEGSARSFSDNEYARTGIAVKEFDLKLYYKNRLAPNLSAKLGTGLSARYMTIDREPLGHEEYTTPSSVFMAGFDLYLSPSLSLGAEGSYRSTLIAETRDQASYDATLRLDTHF